MLNRENLTEYQISVIKKFTNPSIYNLGIFEAMAVAYVENFIICKSAIENDFNDYVYCLDKETEGIVEIPIFADSLGKYPRTPIDINTQDIPKEESERKLFAIISPNELSAIRRGSVKSTCYDDNLIHKYGRTSTTKDKFNKVLKEGQKEISNRGVTCPVSNFMLDLMNDNYRLFEDVGFSLKEFSFAKALKKIIKAAKKGKMLYMVYNDADIPLYVKYCGDGKTDNMYEFIKGNTHLETDEGESYTFEEYINSPEFDGSIFEDNEIYLEDIIMSSVHEEDESQDWDWEDLELELPRWVVIDLTQFMLLKSVMLMSRYAITDEEVANHIKNMENNEENTLSDVVQRLLG